jgi:hypothetical protein
MKGKREQSFVQSRIIDTQIFGLSGFVVFSSVSFLSPIVFLHLIISVQTSSTGDLHHVLFFILRRQAVKYIQHPFRGSRTTERQDALSNVLSIDRLALILDASSSLRSSLCLESKQNRNSFFRTNSFERWETLLSRQTHYHFCRWQDRMM